MTQHTTVLRQNWRTHTQASRLTHTHRHTRSHAQCGLSSPSPQWLHAGRWSQSCLVAVNREQVQQSTDEENRLPCLLNKTPSISDLKLSLRSRSPPPTLLNVMLKSSTLQRGAQNSLLLKSFLENSVSICELLVQSLKTQSLLVS